MESVRILLIEDNPVDALCLREALEDSTGTKFVISHGETLAEARDFLDRQDFSLVVLDLGLPDSQGIDTFLELRNSAPGIPIVVLSGLDDEALAVEAVRLGAQDYLWKDKWDTELLSRSMRYAIERHHLLSQCKMSEEALRQSEQRFRAVFEGSEDYIFVKDRSLKYIDVNPAGAKFLGLPASTIIGRTHGDFFDEKDADYLKDLHIRVLNGETVHQEHSLRIKGAPVTLLEMNVPLRDHTGAIIGIITIGRDITDQKRPETAPGSGQVDYPSKAMQFTLHQARTAARKASTILLTGESGSGKDYLARYIHSKSDRTDGPYFSVNCAAIAMELAESELFGHEKGAFTGAVVRKRGMIELAEGGTLLLNEIGELPLALQAKLLTFFDTRKLTRVGGEREISVNARIIAATNRDLEKEIELGRFRRDLFYRLNVIRIQVPPLRQRLEDLPVLAGEILSQLANEMQLAAVPELEGTVMNTLLSYHWPGNVRELRNVLERHLILWDGKRFDVPALSSKHDGREPVLKVRFRDRTVREVTEEVMRAMYLDALKSCNGNKKEAAKRVGISRDSLYRYMKKFGDITGC